MTGPFEVWRRFLWLWSLPAAFCVLGVLGVLVYQSTFAGNVEDLQVVFAETTEDLEALRAERQQTETLIAEIGTSRENMQVLLAEQFATEGQRFTRAITEAKTLARKAGFQPEGFSYPQSEYAEFGLRQRNIQFQVVGTYDQLRLFINFLELTEQFLTLESISLSESGGTRGSDPRLGIRFDISTVFQEPSKTGGPS